MLVISPALLACFIFYVIMAVVWYSLENGFKRGLFNGCLKWFLPRNNKKQVQEMAVLERGGGQQQPAELMDEKVKKKNTRLKSLDTFRGYKKIKPYYY